MKVAIAIVAAYLMTGAYCIWRDLQLHPVKQPAYARDYAIRGRLSPLVVALIGWPLGALARRLFGIWAAFAILVAIGLYLAGM